MHENADNAAKTTYVQPMREVLIAMVIATSGCSIALQNKPAQGPAKSASANSCSTTPWWIADAVGVAASVAAIAFTVAKGDDANDGITAAGGAGAVGGVLYTASMVNGLRWSAECRAQQREVAAIARAE